MKISLLSGDVNVFALHANPTLIGSPIQVTSSNAAQYPAVALDGSTGDFVVSWLDESTSTPLILAQQFDQSNLALGPIITVSPAGLTPDISSSYGPGVGYLPDGSFAVAWIANNSNGSNPSIVPGNGGGISPNIGLNGPSGDVYVQFYTASGTPDGSPILISPDHNAPGPLAVTANPTNLVVGDSAALTVPSGSYNEVAVIFPIPVPLPPPHPPHPPLPPVVPSNAEAQQAIALVQGEPKPQIEVLPIPLPDDFEPFRVAATRYALPGVLRDPLSDRLQHLLAGNTAFGEITGRLFADLDGRGISNGLNPGLPGRIVFLDLNQNGVLDDGEPSAVTDANGDYVFSGLVFRSYQVRQMLTGDEIQTRPPDNSSYDVRLSANRPSVTDRDFGTMTSQRRFVPRRTATPPPPSPAGGRGDSEEEGENVE